MSYVMFSDIVGKLVGGRSVMNRAYLDYFYDAQNFPLIRFTNNYTPFTTYCNFITIERYISSYKYMSGEEGRRKSDDWKLCERELFMVFFPH